MKYIMKKNKMMLLAAACSILLLGSCGTSKNVQGSGSTSASHQKENATKGSDSRQSETLKKLAFVQKVSDNQVYTKNIVGNMSFTLQAGDKDITVPGKLSMRKDEIIRIQLFIPILGTEVGRLYPGRLPQEAGHLLLFSAGSLLEPAAPAGRKDREGIRPEEV